MTTENQEKMLRFMIEKTGQAIIKVSGISMLPVLREGDDLQIEIREKYTIGDILVYNYNGDGLLVHRLIGESDALMCKGDNAFRIEKISKDKVIGRVAFVNGKKVDKWDRWKIEMSLKIGKSLLELKNLESVKNTALYQMYVSLVLREQLDIKVCSHNMCQCFVLEHEQYRCLCTTPNGKQVEYTGIDAVIVFCAIEEKPIQNFIEDVFKYFIYADFTMINKVYYRICSMVEDQTIIIRCYVSEETSKKY